MEFFKEEYISITVPTGSNQTHVEWWGAPTTDQYKLGCDKILEAVNQNRTTTILVNYFDLESYLDLEVQVWTINVWFSQLQQLGVVKFGVLIPSKIMAQMVIKSIFAGAPAGNIEISYFEVVEDMFSWANIAPATSQHAEVATSQGYGNNYGTTTTAAPIPPPPAPAPIPAPPVQSNPVAAPPVQTNPAAVPPAQSNPAVVPPPAAIPPQGQPQVPNQQQQHQEQPPQATPVPPPPAQQQPPAQNPYAPPQPPSQTPPPPYNPNNG